MIRDCWLASLPKQTFAIGGVVIFEGQFCFHRISNFEGSLKDILSKMP